MKTAIAERAAEGYFASGLNNPGEVRGITQAGYHVGISCNAIRPGLLEEVEAVVELHRVKVFVDSGAFSEVDVVDGALVTVAPITDADWQTRFAIYERLARSCGAFAYLVAPDKVGDQLETLARLTKYRAQMHALRTIHGLGEYGPRIIVPVQNGAMSPADFATAAAEALEMAEDDLVWGIPLKKGATSVEQLAAFAATCPPDGSFHLLGMGPSSPRFEAAMEAILASCPDASITCDAVRITALVGRGEGGVKPRALTAAQDRIRKAHPNITPRELKRAAIKGVVGEEAISLLFDNGWRDPELPPEQNRNRPRASKDKLYPEDEAAERLGAQGSLLRVRAAHLARPL